MKRCFIFAAGSFYGLRERPRAGEDFLIAADAGFLLCRKLGLLPDLLLGDFDSMDAPKDFAHLIRVPVEKDDTDTMLSVKEGLRQGCREFHFYGGTGGKRMDHTLANFQALLYLRRREARGYLYDNDFCWTAMENETLTLEKQVEWGIVSLFPLDGKATGVTLTGLQYPLTEGELEPDVALAVSNHILAEKAVITVRQGALLAGWQLPPLAEESQD